MKKLIAMIVMACIFSACHSDDSVFLEKGDYLIFGHFYGLCDGEGCVEIFMLTDNNLYEDTNDYYTADNFDFQQLDASTFDEVNDLKNYFPEQLLTDDTEIFGCPDCADGGGLYIEVSRTGNVQSWRIDQTKQNVPDYLHEFMDKVNEKIALINN